MSAIQPMSQLESSLNLSSELGTDSPSVPDSRIINDDMQSHWDAFNAERGGATWNDDEAVFSPRREAVLSPRA